MNGKCHVDGMMRKKGQVVVHNSDLEQFAGDHSPGNSCYSFYEENGGKLCIEVGLGVICIT